MTTAISLSSLGRVFETKDVYTHALKDVSLEILQGEFVSILGKSGSGKSTLLYVMGLLDGATSGEYRLFGADVSKLSSAQRAQRRAGGMGFVFQSFNLIGELSVLDNVLLPLRFAGTPGGKEACRQRARDVLELVGLGNRTRHFPSQLSGGQQQRVAIARAIAANPPVIFADEPTGNLDSTTGMEVVQLLKRLHEQGTTVIMVTHDDTLARIADRMIRMQDGQILKEPEGRCLAPGIQAPR